jgi:hypothetical protein
MGRPVLEHFMVEASWRHRAAELGFYAMYLVIVPMLSAAGSMSVLGETDRPVRTFLLLCVAVNGLFSRNDAWASYGSTSVFYLPDYPLRGAAGVGAEAFTTRLSQVLPARADPARSRDGGIAAIARDTRAGLYAAPVMLARLDLDLLKARRLPYRNNRFFLNPSRMASSAP